MKNLRMSFHTYTNQLAKLQRQKKQLLEEIDEKSPVDDLEVGLPAETYKVKEGDNMYRIYKKFKYENFQGHSMKDAIESIMELNPDIKDPSMIMPGMVIKMPYFMGGGPDGANKRYAERFYKLR